MKKSLDSDQPVTRFVLLRGLAREAGHWGAFTDDLMKAVPHSEVITIDLPGTGTYSEMRSPLTIGGIARFLRGKYIGLKHDEAAGIGQRKVNSVLVAISLGGIVASHWLEHWPEDFKACVMINSSEKSVSPVHKRLMFTSYPHLFAILRSRDIESREGHIFDMVSNRPARKRNVVPTWVRLHKLRPISYENSARQLIAAAVYRSKLQRPSCPVLILGSRGDRMVSPSCPETISKRWGAEFRQHATAGHDLPLDEPGWVIEQIVDFSHKNGLC